MACWSEITRDGWNMWYAWMRARRARDSLQGNNVTRDRKQRNRTKMYWLEQSGSKLERVSGCCEHGNEHLCFIKCIGWNSLVQNRKECQVVVSTVMNICVL